MITPATVKVPAAPVANAQLVPSVTVTVFVLDDAVAAGVAPQPVKAAPRTIVGVVDENEKPVGSVAVMVFGLASAPPTVSVVKPTVQVEVACKAVEPGVNVTAEIPMVWPAAGLVAAVSVDVATLKVVFA